MSRALRFIKLIEDNVGISPDEVDNLYPSNTRADILSADGADITELETELDILQKELAEKRKNPDNPENRRDIPNLEKRIKIIQDKLSRS